MTNEINITDTQNVLNSKRFVKGAVQFQSPTELLNPMIQLLSASQGEITLSGTAENSNANTDGSENTAYGRLNLTGKYRIDDEIFYEIGIMAAYDLGSPKLKIYRGAKTAACLNLNIWGTDDIIKFDIAQGINMEAVTNYINSVQEKIQRSIEIVNRLKATLIPENLMQQIIGKMLIRTISEKTLNGSTSILNAVALLTDDKNKYFHKQEGFNAWLLFNSFTEHFSTKVNAFDIPEKTLATYKLLEEINSTSN